MRLFTARPKLRSPEPGYEYPAWTYNALGGRPEVIDPGMFVAGKTIAGTLLDLITQPEELEKAKEEFDERTGGGVGGSKWLGPLLPPDFLPPVDLRWPEYVSTERARSGGSRRLARTPGQDRGFKQALARQRRKKGALAP